MAITKLYMGTKLLPLNTNRLSSIFVFMFTVFPFSETASLTSGLHNSKSLHLTVVFLRSGCSLVSKRLTELQSFTFPVPLWSTARNACRTDNRRRKMKPFSTSPYTDEVMRQRVVLTAKSGPSYIYKPVFYIQGTRFLCSGKMINFTSWLCLMILCFFVIVSIVFFNYFFCGYKLERCPAALIFDPNHIISRNKQKGV